VRKRWRTVAYPMLIRSWPSRKAAYEHVERLRAGRECGMNRTESVTVQVDEGLGFGWADYERIHFGLLGGAS
jgi:hypothetical protein